MRCQRDHIFPRQRWGGKHTEEKRAVKKVRNERRKTRKEKRARVEAEANNWTSTVPVLAISFPPTDLRRATPNVSPPLKYLTFDKYSHNFKREHAMASVILSQDEKYNELIMKICMLAGQAHKVDSTFVIESATEGDTRGR